MQIAGQIPYWTLSDYPPGVSDAAGDHAGHRTVFLPGCFADHLARAKAGVTTIRLLAEHTYARELASTAAGTLSFVDGTKSLLWLADLTTAPGVPVRACSPGCANARRRPYTFRSGEVVQVIERAHLLEISLVTSPAFERDAWARVVPPPIPDPAPRSSPPMTAAQLFPATFPNPFAPHTADVADTLLLSLLAGGHLRRDEKTGELVPTESGRKLAEGLAQAGAVRPDLVVGLPLC